MVRLEPHKFDKPLPEALEEALTEKLANKVVKDVGLVLSVWDILEIGDSFLFPGGGGASHTRVAFRLLVFRPALDEVLVGKVKGCSRNEGVRVSLGFFEDILIPPEALQHPQRFDEAEQVWVWEYPSEDGHVDLFMDSGEEVRFRVTAEQFVDTSPSTAAAAAAEASAAGGSRQGPQDDGDVADDRLEDQPDGQKVPYQLMASVNEPGLGLLSWWNS